MNLNKILKKIKKNKKNIFLNNIQKNPFRKKRKNFIVKIDFLKKLKLLGNNKKNYYILFLIIFIIFILYLILGPIFKIKSIEIIKEDDLTNMIISYNSIDNMRGKNIREIEKKQILNNLQNYQQNIKDIKINIILPNTLKIMINSYKGIFNTTINNKTFIITENGTAIPSKYSNDLNELIIKNGIEIGKFLDYKKILEGKYITNIYNTKKILEDNIINIKVKNIIYYVNERELHIETENNTKIIFDLESDTKEQIKKLIIFNKEQINIEKNQLIYIDLRIKNKIFYCLKENQYLCNQNIKNVYD